MHSGPGRAPNLVRALTQTPSLVTSSCPDLVDTKNEVNVEPQYIEGSRGVDQNSLVCGPGSRVTGFINRDRQSFLRLHCNSRKPGHYCQM